MIELKRISEIEKNFFFFIPDYQRGYKWTNQHVIALLDDIFEFADSSSRNLNKTYCLQPVVVKKMELSDKRLKEIGVLLDENEYYELIDGQQRLTTIYLILSFLNKRYKEEFETDKFQLHYETRKRSREFLLKPNENGSKENIDFHHIWSAYKTIESYFSDKKKDINLFESTLLFRTQVIWYDVEEDVTAEDVFKRLNNGKIPLDNSELIKALFLGNHHESKLSYQSRYQIAIEWESIESKLLDDQFWYFLDNSKNSTNRISYLFSILAKELNVEHFYKMDEKDERFEFLVFVKYFKNNPNIKNNWDKVKKLYLILLNWFEDRNILHFAGYLMTDDLGYTVIDLLEIYNGEDITNTYKFKKALLDKVSENLSSINLKGLQYPKNNEKIRMVLLWHNISYILKSESHNYRFQFDQYKDLKYDLEHIKSVSSEIFKSEKSQNEWLKDFFFFFTKKKIDTVNSLEEITVNEKLVVIIEEAFKYLKNDSTKKEFGIIYSDIINHFGIKDLDALTENGIRNLCLLDQKTNRGYKNAIFPIKRNVIIQNDINGFYILPNTKSVFLKQYSEDVQNMMQWNENDMEDYFKQIEEEITNIDKLIDQYVE